MPYTLEFDTLNAKWQMLWSALVRLDLCLHEQEFDVLRELVRFLKPFKDISDFFSCSLPTLSLIPLIKTCTHKNCDFVSRDRGIFCSCGCARHCFMLLIKSLWTDRITTDNPTPVYAWYVWLNTDRSASNPQGYTFKCQGISQCLESGHPVKF